MNLINIDIRMLRSLISIVETGSLSETARKLGRTQPAITLQMQRLEELTGKQLFVHEKKGLTLTSDGNTVLAYAKSILRLHDDLILELASQEIEGHVVLGTPDLYAAFYLPSILSAFHKSFPRIQVDLNCSPSTPLVDLVKGGKVDVALVTRMNDFTGGQVVGREQLIWMTGKYSNAHRERPIPLALLPEGNIYRDYAIESLERARLRWRITSESKHVSGLQTIALAGMAVTVLGRRALIPSLREIDEDEGFPLLPEIELLLYKSPRASKAAIALHDYIKHYLRVSKILNENILHGVDSPIHIV